MALGRAMIIKASAWKPVERLVRGSFLFRPLVKRFIAGDTLDEAMVQVDQLAERGFQVSLDCLGENTKTEAEALKACEVYKAMLRRIGINSRRDQMNISIKLTQCGLDQGDDFAEKNLREVLAVAEQSSTFVRVDMESSEYTERTIQMIERVHKDFKNTGTVLQSYLHRTPSDTEKMIQLGARVRMVKGAYLEPESVAFQSKAKVDEVYVECSKRLLIAGNYPAIATHDENIVNVLREFVEKEGVSKDRFEWQMLFGIRRDLQNSLLADGYRVRVYVPFGDSWYPYFTRRLAERPANFMFILRSLFKG